jgi:hypothetical protein
MAGVVEERKSGGGRGEGSLGVVEKREAWVVEEREAWGSRGKEAWMGSQRRREAWRGRGVITLGSKGGARDSRGEGSFGVAEEREAWGSRREGSLGKQRRGKTGNHGREAWDSR